MRSNLKAIEINVAEGVLSGTLCLPENPHSIIVFAHGSGSSRNSPRNRAVAETLNKSGFATLLLDLLTKEEETSDQFTSEHRFDIDLLAERLLVAVRYLSDNKTTESLNIGLFGASTGSAAALVAAADIPNIVHAVVSRGGRPDLATSYLPLVKAPTLLIVGENDLEVMELNRSVMKEMTCQKHLEIVPNATHLFEEPGCLEQVAQLSTNWFQQYLQPSAIAS